MRSKKIKALLVSFGMTLSLCAGLTPQNAVLAAEENDTSYMEEAADDSMTSEDASVTDHLTGDGGTDVGESDSENEKIVVTDRLTEDGEVSVAEGDSSDENIPVAGSDTDDGVPTEVGNNSIDMNDSIEEVQISEEEIAPVEENEEVLDPETEEEFNTVEEADALMSDSSIASPISSLDRVITISSTDEWVSYMSGGTSGKRFKLAKDLDFGTADSPVYSFYGTLDGANHTIKNYRGYLIGTNEGIVKNLKFEEFEINDAIVLNNEGIIENCSVDKGCELLLSNDYYHYRNHYYYCCGGLCRINAGTIANCRVSIGSISGVDRDCGGITGQNNGTIKNSVFLGNGDSSALDGKIVGDRYYTGNLFNCYSPDFYSNHNTVGLTPSSSYSTDHNYAVSGTKGDYGYQPYTQEQMKSKEFLKVLNAPLTVHKDLSPWIIDTSISPYPIPAPKYGVQFGSISHGMIEADKDYAYKGQKVNLTITPDSGYVVTGVKAGSTKLSVKSNTASFTMGSAPVKLTATFKRAYKINKASTSHGSFSLSKSQAFSGDSIKITIKPSSGYAVNTVKASTGKSLKKVNNTTYTFVMNASNCQVSVSFYKIPVKTAVKKLTKGSKSFTATWTKKSGMSGYQLSYSLKKNFTGSSSKSLIISSSRSSYTIRRLLARRTYYVRIRSYTLKSGKKVYSEWSAVKSVKTK